jgi:hypothetical protein
MHEEVAPTLPPLLSPPRSSFITRNSIRNVSNKYKCEFSITNYSQGKEEAFPPWYFLLKKSVNANKYCNYKDLSIAFPLPLAANVNESLQYDQNGF